MFRVAESQLITYEKVREVPSPSGGFIRRVASGCLARQPVELGDKEKTYKNRGCPLRASAGALAWTYSARRIAIGERSWR